MGLELTALYTEFIALKCKQRVKTIESYGNLISRLVLYLYT